VADYRKCKSITEYREAVAKEGRHFAICCAWPLSQLMAREHLTFPEAFERAFASGMLIAAHKELEKLLRERKVLKSQESAKSNWKKL
jgi:hypothetical protein